MFRQINMIQIKHNKLSGRRGGLMVSALDSGALCCVLRQDTLLSQCLSPPRCINGYQRIVGENLTICGGLTCDGLASRPGVVEILPAASCYRNRDKLRHQWALRPLRLRFYDQMRVSSKIPKNYKQNAIGKTIYII